MLALAPTAPLDLRAPTVRLGLIAVSALCGLAACSNESNVAAGGATSSGVGAAGAGGGHGAGPNGGSGGSAPACVAQPLSWTETTPLPAPRESHELIAVGGRLYALGGWHGAAHADGWMAEPAVDGAIAAWTPLVVLPTPLEHHGSFAHDGHVYVVGGDDGSQVVDGAWFAAIEPDGSLGSWQPTACPGPLAAHVNVRAGDFTYALGGGPTFGQETAAVSFSSILPGDGGLTAWVTTTSLPEPRALFAAVAFDRRVHSIGGGSLGAPSSALFSATVEPSGVIRLWEPGELPFAVVGHAAFVAHEYALVVGGVDSAAVWLAPIAPGGYLGAWTEQTSLPESRFGHRGAAVGAYVYVVGGYDSSSQVQSTVFVARLCAPAGGG